MRFSTATSIFYTVAISGGAAQTLDGDITTGVSAPPPYRLQGDCSVSNAGSQSLGNAPAVTDNPSGAQYMATLPDTAFDKTAFPSGNVKGSVQAVSMPDGNGVMFHVAFSNLPTTGGPFSMLNSSLTSHRPPLSFFFLPCHGHSTCLGSHVL